MKKIFASTALVALALTATPALASDRDDRDERRDVRVKADAKVRAEIGKFGWAWGRHAFALSGTVAEVGTNSLTINVKEESRIDDDLIVDNQVLVVANADTKIYGKDKTALTLADIKVGDSVKIAGSVSGTTLTATHIADKSRPQVMAFGKVTAKTDNSVTITNSTTGLSQTVAVNGDTNVAINGQEAALADISVGDVGWVKFKNVAGDFVAKFIRLFR